MNKLKVIVSSLLALTSFATYAENLPSHHSLVLTCPDAAVINKLINTNWRGGGYVGFWSAINIRMDNESAHNFVGSISADLMSDHGGPEPQPDVEVSNPGQIAIAHQTVMSVSLPIAGTKAFRVNNSYIACEYKIISSNKKLLASKYEDTSGAEIFPHDDAETFVIQNYVRNSNCVKTRLSTVSCDITDDDTPPAPIDSYSY